MGPAWQIIVGYYYGSLIPGAHHARKERVRGTLEHFLGLAHHHMITQCHAPIQTYAKKRHDC